MGRVCERCCRPQAHRGNDGCRQAVLCLRLEETEARIPLWFDALQEVQNECRPCMRQSRSCVSPYPQDLEVEPGLWFSRQLELQVISEGPLEECTAPVSDKFPPSCTAPTSLPFGLQGGDHAPPHPPPLVLCLLVGATCNQVQVQTRLALLVMLMLGRAQRQVRRRREGGRDGGAGLARRPLHPRGPRRGFLKKKRKMERLSVKAGAADENSRKTLNVCGESHPSLELWLPESL
jgi:hypothetical protein